MTLGTLVSALGAAPEPLSVLHLNVTPPTTMPRPLARTSLIFVSVPGQRYLVLIFAAASFFPSRQ